MSQPETIAAGDPPCAEPGAPRPYAYATEAGPDAGHGVPDAEDALQAAIGWLEVCGPPADEAGTVSVTVIDCETGRRECFRIELASGRAGPC
jgi:hypothetical protein